MFHTWKWDALFVKLNALDNINGSKIFSVGEN